MKRLLLIAVLLFGAHAEAQFLSPFPAVRSTYRLLAHGDSITNDLADLAQNYSQVVQLAEQAHATDLVERGIGGQSWNYIWPSSTVPATLIDDAVTQIDAKRKAGVRNKLVVFAGTNGITLGGHTATAEAADFDTYINARISAGWDMADVTVVTMLARSGVNESDRAAYNAALVSKAVTYGYKLARVDLDPNIGGSGYPSNPTYCYDGIHPTAAGQAIIASIVDAVSFP